MHKLDGCVKELVAKILYIAFDAGRAILDFYKEPDFKIEHKDRGEPLTLADRESHRIITKGLLSIDRSIALLSEEGKDIPYETRKKWEYFWLIDPLDGTKEFIKRNAEFTVNIALIYRNEPIAGCVYAPVGEVFYFAAKEEGAYRLQGDKELNLCRTWKELVAGSQQLPLKFPKRAFTIVGSRSHMSEDTRRYINELRSQQAGGEVVSRGSSLKFCMVAEAGADVYPRFEPTMEWDTAAGQIIVEEAGGRVVSIADDQPLKYNKKNLLNPAFIADLIPSRYKKIP